jgi:hypothetical protein
VFALHEHHAAQTCCKLLKKRNNTNLSERQHNYREVFQRLKVPYGRVNFPNRYQVASRLPVKAAVNCEAITNTNKKKQYCE